MSRKYGIQSTSGKGRIGEDTRARIREYVGRQSEAENQSTNNLAVVLPNDAYTTNAPSSGVSVWNQ